MTLGKLYDKFYNTLVRHSPPGIKISSFENYFWSGLALTFASTVGLIFNMLSRFQSVIAYRKSMGLDAPLPEHIFMPEFDEFFRLTFWAYLFTLCFMLACVIFNYLYFRQGSQSIYVMKRLKDKKKLHHLCWSVPLSGIAFSTVVLILLYALFCWVYFKFSPEGSIPAQTIAFFWRYVP